MKRSVFKRSTKPMKRTAFKKKPHISLPKVFRKKKRRKLPAIKTLRNKLDRLFSIAIRNRDKINYNDECPFCGGEIQCNFHFITRGKAITRWDPDNCIGACHLCNQKEVGDSTPYIAWYARNFGQDQLEEIIRRSRVVANFGNTEIRGMWDAFETGGLGGLSEYLKIMRENRENLSSKAG